MNFLASPADIVIGGSAAGVGKTFALLLEFMRHIDNPKWGGVIFRRTSPQITLEGGLWATSMDLYPHIGAVPKETTHQWTFPSRAKLKFSHLEYEKNILDWQGAQIPFIGFDELTHFTEKMFFYLMSRNRSTCGVKPYIRATCNPDPESWVAKLIAWWIDQDTGFPIPERDGVIRYFIRYGNDYIFGDTKAEVLDKASHIIDKMVEEANIDPEDLVKSLTFISGSIYQNQELLKVNPGYLANLLSQDEASRSSLLDGNWKFVAGDMDIYDFASFNAMFTSNLTINRLSRMGPVATRYGETHPKGRIVADIALEGSNKFMVGYFEGRELVDVETVDKSSGGKVLRIIKEMADKYRVPNNKILFDADGVGGFLGGSEEDAFLEGAIPFHGGSAPLMVYDKLLDRNVKENYFNLKTQLVYRSGAAVNSGQYRVSKYAADKKYDDTMTIKDRMAHERKAFKKKPRDTEGKLRIIDKKEMKIILQNESPDVMDMFFMNEFFETILERKTASMTAEESRLLDY